MLPPTNSLSRRGILKASAALSAATLLSTFNPQSAHAAGTDKIRVGLIGCGGRGKGAAANCVDSSPNVQLVAMGDLLPDQLDLAKKTFADKEKTKYDIKDDHCFLGWDAYQKVLASDVDLVILATPPAFRPMMIEAAIAAGKHVFAEKPVAVDPVGARKVIAAAEIAKSKNLAIVAGTQRRHQASYTECIKRIHDGALGEIISGRGYWMQGTLWNKPRDPKWSDMEFQLRNWLYFTWLSGDHIVEQHLHQIDVMNWVMGGPPRWAVGVGGRMVRTGPEFGHIYDFFSIQYEYKNGAQTQCTSRQMDNTYNKITEEVWGTKGKAICDGKLYDPAGKVTWKYDSEEDINPYVQEHADLIKSIRDGKPLNEGKQTAESVLTAVMGRLSAYTGKIVTWQMIMDSKLDLFPAKLEMGPLPVAPVALPGTEKWV